MLQIRIHGRGGQGVVTCAEVLALAAFADGKETQAFPSFGSERMGAPVMAFCRIDDRPVRRRDAVTHPDVLIVQDPTLLGQVDLFAGFDREKGYLLLNTARTLEELGLQEIAAALPPRHAATVPASDLALAHVGRNVPNAPLAGGFAALTGRLRLEAVEAALAERFPGEIGGRNARAARAAYEHVRRQLDTSSMEATRHG